METCMDQWGFQGITILQEILGRLFSRELLRDLANLNGVPLLQGSLFTMGNNNIVEGALARFGKISMEFLRLGGFMRESLRDLGKSQWSSFIWGLYEGITARFGKISMEFLHLGGLQGYQNSCLKGAGDEYSHGPMRSTVWGINWGKLTYGEKWTYGSLQSRFGKIWRKAVYSSCPR